MSSQLPYSRLNLNACLAMGVALYSRKIAEEFNSKLGVIPKERHPECPGRAEKKEILKQAVQGLRVLS